MYLESISIDSIQRLEIFSLKSLLEEGYRIENNGPDTETGKKLKAIEDAIKHYPVSTVGELEIKVWLAKSIIFGMAPVDPDLEGDGDSPEEQIISQILRDTQRIKKKVCAEYNYGAEVAQYKDSPDFELIRMVKASQLLGQAFNLDPRDEDECPEKVAYLDQSRVLDNLIAEMPAKTPEGLRAKIMLTWDDYGISCGGTPTNLVEGVFENVINFLDNQQKAA